MRFWGYEPWKVIVFLRGSRTCDDRLWRQRTSWSFDVDIPNVWLHFFKSFSFLTLSKQILLTLFESRLHVLSLDVCQFLTSLCYWYVFGLLYLGMIALVYYNQEGKQRMGSSVKQSCWGCSECIFGIIDFVFFSHPWFLIYVFHLACNSRRLCIYWTLF